MKGGHRGEVQPPRYASQSFQGTLPSDLIGEKVLTQDPHGNTLMVDNSRSAWQHPYGRFLK